MNQAMYAAASGMAAEQNQLDTVTENLANADVTAFKGHVADIVTLGSALHPLGVTVDGAHPELKQGKLERSGGPCDLGIRGEGFFVVQRGAEVAYTRDGSFSRDPGGRLSNSDGWHLAGVNVPKQAEQLHVAEDGSVRAMVGGKPAKLGSLRLACFAAPEHLDAMSPTLFTATQGSGAARLVTPGREHGSEICFGTLERSNVSIVEAMMEILKAQRAYEADAKGIQAADDMTRIANNIERS